MTEAKVAEAVARLVEAAHPRRLYLFGSFVRDEMGPDSDLDVLVVAANSLDDPRAESVRLRRQLRGIHMPVDIIVVSENTFNAHRSTPGLIYHEVENHGRLVYDNTQ